jgi:hypothetical protein
LATDSSKRRVEPRPESDWIVYTDEALRIVPEDVWRKVQARRRATCATVTAGTFSTALRTKLEAAEHERAALLKAPQSP